ncbi:MAG: carbohydrate kinase family protein [Bacteroidales bacterium]|nr:carbohydrate kinase family protein [Bacteroidales bacterium]
MNNKKIIVIGAAVADITGIVNKKLILADSNPGKVTFTAGGVGRNMAENLARLGVSVDFIASFGEGFYGKGLVENCKNAGISIENSIIDKYKTSAIYLSVNNHEGDLAIAVSDTDITEIITPDFLETKAEIFAKTDVILLDTNLTQETLEYICTKFQDKKIFVDFVSTSKAQKVKDFIGKFHTIKPNLIEAEALSGISYNSDKDLPKMLDYFLKKGVKQVFISLGSRGCFYGNETENGIFESAKISPVNASGAGDAFISGVVYSFLHEKDIRQTACYATAMSIAALMSNSAVNENISENYINQIIKKYNLC